MEYGYESWGVYLGTWASSVNTMTSDGEIEIRGLRGEFAATGIAWDLGAVYYHYPEDELEPEKDYVEPKLGLSHEFAGLPLMPRVSASVHYSLDFSLEAGKAVYADGTVGMSLKGVLGGELPAQERLDLRGAPARHGQLFEARARVDLE